MTWLEELTLLALIINALSGGTFLPVVGALLAGLLVCGCVALWQARRERRTRVVVPPPDDPAWEGLWAALLADDDAHDVFPEEEER